MNRFAALLDRLAYERGRLGKLALLEAYFRETSDPDRGWALAAMTGSLSFKNAKPSIIRNLAEERFDPTLLHLSYDYVGDLAEAVALLWEPRDARANAELSLSDVVEGLATTAKEDLPARLADWLDRLDENGRWALLKLITGALRIGVSARLARTALARLAGREPDEIEDVWHADAPPYRALFAWLEGKGEAPRSVDDVQVAAAEYPQFLKAAYGEESFPKPRNIIGLAQDLPVPEMERLMMQNAKASDDDMRQLAAQRAQAVRDGLLASGQVGTERLFVVAAKPLTAEERAKLKGRPNRVDFAMK